MEDVSNAQVVDYVTQCYYELYDYRCSWKLELERIARFKDGSMFVSFGRVGDESPSDAVMLESAPVYADPPELPTGPDPATSRFRLASFNRLVLHITDPDIGIFSISSALYLIGLADDPYQTRVFLYCFRTFTRPSPVFDKLLQRRKLPPPRTSDPLSIAQHRITHLPAVQNAVCSVLLQWINICPADFDDREVAPRFEEFLSVTLPAEGNVVIAETLHAALEVRVYGCMCGNVCGCA